MLAPITTAQMPKPDANPPERSKIPMSGERREEAALWKGQHLHEAANECKSK